MFPCATIIRQQQMTLQTPHEVLIDADGSQTPVTAQAVLSSSRRRVRGSLPLHFYPQIRHADRRILPIA